MERESEGKGRKGEETGRENVTELENARSSKNWIGPIRYFSAERDRRFSTDPVLTARQARLIVSVGLHTADAATACL